ncbi:MAG: T9SS type A sorting domain-containing protein [Nonlabens sp.]
MKKITILKSIFTMIMLAFFFSGSSQNRTCGMNAYMEEMLKDPVLAAEYKANQKKFKAELARRENGDFSQRGSGTIVIPVAVHFPSGSEADRDCLVALAQTQIDILNADYSATNDDISNWTAAAVFYPGLQPGVSNIQFCMATTNHPQVDPELLEGEPAVTIGYAFAGGSGFPELDSNWVGYMNFLVKNIGGNLLGYSPGGGSLANGGAVVLNLGAFSEGSGCFGSGIIPQSPFNLGRTTTHELGHFYSLAHPWGPGGASCASDDGFTDTPNSGIQSTGCPAPGSLTACSPAQNVLSMNYMDYANDACMYMFTPQQMNAVDAYVSSVIAPAVKPGVCEPAAPSFNLTANIDELLTCPNTDTQVSFEFVYSSDQGFDEETTFSVEGQPSGTTVLFNPPTLDTDGVVTLTISNLSDSALGNYDFSVIGTSSSMTKSLEFTLNNNCTEIICESIMANSDDLPLIVTDGLEDGGIGTPIAEITVNVPDSIVTDGMTVSVDLTHTYMQDLILRLIHPTSTDANPIFVDLLAQQCTFENLGSGNIIVFDDEASALSCPDGSTSDVIPAGSYAPSEPLSTFDGLDAQGDWVLLVADTFAGDTGTLNSLELSICSEQSLSVTEFSSNDFAIFPNPNKGEFTITLNSQSGNAINVDVFDIRGRQIFKNVYDNTANFNEVVRLNNVQAGMYLVTVSDGDQRTTKKIIVE